MILNYCSSVGASTPKREIVHCVVLLYIVHRLYLLVHIMGTLYPLLHHQRSLARVTIRDGCQGYECILAMRRVGSHAANILPFHPGMPQRTSAASPPPSGIYMYIPQV